MPTCEKCGTPMTEKDRKTISGLEKRTNKKVRVLFVCENQACEDYLKKKFYDTNG
jgi:hypothetical protein